MLTVRLDDEDLPTSEDLRAILSKGLPVYEVDFGWGVTDWVLVKKYFFVGARVAINKKKRRIEIRPTYGSKWFVVFVVISLGLALIIDAFNIPSKRRLMAEVQACLDLAFSDGFESRDVSV